MIEGLIKEPEKTAPYIRKLLKGGKVVAYRKTSISYNWLLG
jgi:hypothetical protein